MKKKPHSFVRVFLEQASEPATAHPFTLRISVSDPKGGWRATVSATFCIITPASGHSRSAFADEEMK